MNHTPNCKMQNYKTSRIKYRIWEKNSCNPGFVDDFLDITGKVHSTKKKKGWVLLKIKSALHRQF